MEKQNNNNMDLFFSLENQNAKIVAANQHKYTYAKEAEEREGEVILIYFKLACTFYVSLAPSILIFYSSCVVVKRYNMFSSQFTVVLLVRSTISPIFLSHYATMLYYMNMNANACTNAPRRSATKSLSFSSFKGFVTSRRYSGTLDFTSFPVMSK